MEEERTEIKNDFMIKFASFTDEISELKIKLSKYEKEEDEQPGVSTASKQPTG